MTKFQRMFTGYLVVFGTMWLVKSSSLMIAWPDGNLADVAIVLLVPLGLLCLSTSIIRFFR